MPNYTQVTEEVYEILRNAQAYEFNCRGKVKVKGKGDMTTYFLTDRRATATMRVDDLQSQHQFYVNPQVQYSNIGSQNWNLHQNHQHQMAQIMMAAAASGAASTVSGPMPPSPLSQRRLQQMQMVAEATRQQQLQQQLYQQQQYGHHHEQLVHHTEEEEPLIPPRSTSNPIVRPMIRPQTPPSHSRHNQGTDVNYSQS
jgi:hypothetical protein